MSTQLGMDADSIILYEDGELSDEKIIAMFQRGIDDGSVWHLQGHYGRTASLLIRAGHCTERVNKEIP